MSVEESDMNHDLGKWDHKQPETKIEKQKNLKPPTNRQKTKQTTKKAHT